jgi:pimeloyl-ACP methyl ester carboxylesterase
MWHGSWCWGPVTQHLAGLGVPAVAVDLAGHGLDAGSPPARWRRPFDPVGYATEPSPVATVTASSAAETLVGQLRRIGGGRPCLVVAHSMGGVVATVAAEQAPELFAEVVYLSAFAPVGGRPAAHYLALPENAGDRVTPLLVADPARTGALRLDTGDPGQHPILREVFYGDVDEATADAAIALLSPDGPAGILGEPVTVTAGRFGALPHTYLVCTKDHVVPEALQRLLVAEIDSVSSQKTTVLELDSSHSPFLSRPRELAEVIAGRHREHRPDAAAAHNGQGPARRTTRGPLG